MEGTDASESFYRLTLSLTQGATAVSGSLSKLSGGLPVNTATFATVLGAPFNWNGTGTVADGLRLTTGVGGTSNFDVDNLTVASAVPEPSIAVLGGLGMLGLFIRRPQKRTAA